MLLGRAQYRHQLAVPLEEHLLLMAAPHLQDRAAGGHRAALPGAVISTTTKADIFALTSGVRAARGPVHVFNLQSIGNIASTFRWSPLQGCEAQAVAIRRADAFAQAVSQKGIEDGTFWSAKASDYLRAYFHAAALAGADMTVVARRIPSDLVRRTRPVWQYRPVPALSALLPALSGVSRLGLRSAPARLLRQPGEEDLPLPRFPAPHGAPAPRGAHSRKVQQPVWISEDCCTQPGTVTCGEVRWWTCCLWMACKRSGVRIPVAPPVRLI